MCATRCIPGPCSSRWAPRFCSDCGGDLAVALFGVLIAVRAVLEEETLKAELEGYADYAAHVRYRLVPLLW